LAAQMGSGVYCICCRREKIVAARNAAFRFLSHCRFGRSVAAHKRKLGHGNSVPRFHVTWGNGGPELFAPFVARARSAVDKKPAHLQVFAIGSMKLTKSGGNDRWECAAKILEPSEVERGRRSFAQMSSANSS